MIPVERLAVEQHIDERGPREAGGGEWAEPLQREVRAKATGRRALLGNAAVRCRGRVEYRRCTPVPRETRAQYYPRTSYLEIFYSFTTPNSFISSYIVVTDSVNSAPWAFFASWIAFARL